VGERNKKTRLAQSLFQRQEVFPFLPKVIPKN